MPAITGVQFTSANKMRMVESLALAFERGTIKIIPDPVLVGELQAFEMKRLPSGTMRYSAPDGMHDDAVMALCLAWHSIAQSFFIWTTDDDDY